MKKISAIFLSLFFSLCLSQSFDSDFPQNKMKADFKIFKNIRQKANSGLYKYRTKKQIDSIYNWADAEISNSKTYGDFYNILTQLTDFEGSLHNETYLPETVVKSLKVENYGYFPFPIKWINGKWIINFKNDEIPLGSEIISINNKNIESIIENLNKYYTTDGFNLTGKRIGLNKNFPKYYRYNYGLVKSFKINYKEPSSEIFKSKTVNSIGYSDYYKNFSERYSTPIDQTYYSQLKPSQKYYYKILDSKSAVLTINSFGMGGENADEHKKYKKFLDSSFVDLKSKNIQNLVIDIRNNGGGDDPNEVMTYSYLSSRNFQENKQAWVSFNKVPFLKYLKVSIPRFIRPLVVGKYNKELKEIFSEERDAKFYQSKHIVWKPTENVFHGKIYLLIGPAVASAGSLFAAMVSTNGNTTTIGEETMGGYYGHNGHSPVEYKLPNSKIVTKFSIVNLEQDVPKKENQPFGRGIIPDAIVTQTFEDFLKQNDTQYNYTIDLIKNENSGRNRR